MQGLSHRFPQDIMMFFKALSRRVIIAALLGAAVFLAGCAGEVPVTDSVKFVLFGNTSPASPFSGFTPSLDTAIAEIESWKPAIVIHTGDAIYGGSDSEGIYENDVRRQYRIFFSSMKSFHSACYSIPGDRDLFNGNSLLYAEYSGRSTWYSFNYGSMHFIALDTAVSNDSFIDEKQMEWLRKDLSDFRRSNAIFVIMHRPFITSKKRGPQLPVPDELHKLFAEYRVQAVFSGGEKSYSISVFDSVRYIQAGCSGFIDEKENRRTNQYYVVTFINGELDVRPLRINLTKKS